MGADRDGFELMQGSPTGLEPISGCHWVLRWEGGKGGNSRQPGSTNTRAEGLGNGRILISAMRGLAISLQTGAIHEKTTAAIVPTDLMYSAPIWTFITSSEYANSVRKIYKKTAVATGSMLAVPFDLAHWQKVAAEKYPNGLPEPYSDDPTQWLFHGHPRYVEAGTELHVAVARLAGYRWPAETDPKYASRPKRAPASPRRGCPKPMRMVARPVPVLGARPLADGCAPIAPPPGGMPGRRAARPR